MAQWDISTQKYVSILTLFGLNLLLCITFGFHPDKWYAFIFILALGTFINSLSVLSLFINWITNTSAGTDASSFASLSAQVSKGRNILYFVPCYNETRAELTKTLNSLTSQYHQTQDEIGIIIICDGRVRGVGSDNSTDVNLKLILRTYNGIQDSYKNAAGETVTVEVVNCFYQGVKVLLLIKDINQGKRDSVTLVRRLALNISSEVTRSLLLRFIAWNDGLPNYIVGVDADTVLDNMCTQKLVTRLEQGGVNCMGCVGLVVPKRKWNTYVMFQYAEYHFGQFLRRRAQSELTHKVNCLSGCNQILRVCPETCGDKLLNRFNRIPEPEESIFSHIRSYASEDRNHVCLMLSMYPYVTTVQEPEALAWTGVPETVQVFLSQRRRWTLGALSNDMLLTYLPGINLFERIASLINIIIFSVNPFILASAVFFINAIVNFPNMLMLYLSIPMVVPHAYTLLAVPLLRGFWFKEIVYYYLSYIVYLAMGLPVSTVVYIYSLLGMDTFKWGKTRRITSTLESNSETPWTLVQVPVPVQAQVPVQMQEQDNEWDDNGDNGTDMTTYEMCETDV